MKIRKYTLLIGLLFLIPAFAEAQIKTASKNIEDKILIDNEKNLLKSTIKTTSALKPNLGGNIMVPAGNTVTLNPGGYNSYLWESDASTAQTFTIGADGQCCNKVTVSDLDGNLGEDQVSVTIKDPTVGFYNIEREEPYNCGDVIVLKAFSYCDAGGYIVPGFAISIRTDESSSTENKMVFYRNGNYYAEEGIGAFYESTKHYVNLQYINPNNEWKYALVDLGETGQFHSISQDNSDWSTIQRNMFQFSEGTNQQESNLGYAKGTATFSGTGVSNHENGYGRFYADLAGPGTHTITYTWNDGRGFEGSASQTITVSGETVMVDAIIQDDTTICTGESLILSTENNFSLNFDGLDDHVYVEDNESLDLTSQGTIEAWIYPNFHQALGGIIHKGDLADWSDEAYSLQLWNDKRLRFAVVGEGESNKNATVLRSTSKLELNNWYHVVGTWDESGLKVYINGVLDNSSIETTVARVSEGGLNIGSLLNENYSEKLKKMPFNGFIDEARVWNRAISEQEIAANMMKSLNAEQENGLIANFNFNEGVGVEANDNSENKLIGVLVKPQWSTFVPFGESDYTYSWNSGETTPNIDVTPTETYTYIVTISANGCNFQDEVLVSFGETGAQTIAGNLSYSEGLFLENEINVKVYQLPDYDLVSEQNIDENSEYSFDLETGNYILRAVLNNTNYPDVINTYYDSTYSYRLAEIIELNCNDNFKADINMFEAEPLAGNSAGGIISGTISYINNAKTENKEISANKTNLKTAEIPVIGAIVTAELENENKPIDITDISLFENYLFHKPKAFSQSNDFGYYELSNLEFGNYALQVNLPGFEMNSTFEIEISENLLTHQNLNFIVDGNITMNVTNISTLDNSDFNLKVFPNPTIEKLSVEYNLKNENSVKMTLFNTNGQKVFFTEKKNVFSGNYIEEININKSGIYFLELVIGNTVYLKKIIRK